jgi:hypothetical protein
MRFVQVNVADEVDEIEEVAEPLMDQKQIEVKTDCCLQRLMRMNVADEAGEVEQRARMSVVDKVDEAEQLVQSHTDGEQVKVRVLQIAAQKIHDCLSSDRVATEGW